jgi:Uncharacterized protein, homolog of phage Mu protein gp30
MNAADIASLYTNYKRFTVSSVKAWKPKIHANLKEMIRNATDEPTIQRAIAQLDANMLKPSGIMITIRNIYIDAGRIWGGRIYQVIKKEGDLLTRQAEGKKALMPIGYNEEMIAIIEAYFRLHNLSMVSEINDTMKEWILKQLIDAQQTGRSIQDVAKSMLVDDFPAKRAIVIARTETIKAANFGAVQGAKKTGFETEKLWIAARDNRTRRIPRDNYSHVAMDGKTVPMDQPFLVPMLNGGFDEVMQPGDPKADPGDVIQCRCTVGFNVIRDARGLPVKL